MGVHGQVCRPGYYCTSLATGTRTFPVSPRISPLTGLRVAGSLLFCIRGQEEEHHIIIISNRIYRIEPWGILHGNQTVIY